jgi:hypothetical protein
MTFRSDAFQATFSDFRLVKGRKCCQLIFEVPVEEADHAVAVLGGIPNPEHSIYVGIARIDPGRPKLKPTDVWRASAECAMLCKDKRFQRYVLAKNEPEAIVNVRRLCQVESRREFDRDEDTAMLWRQINPTGAGND